MTNAHSFYIGYVARCLDNGSTVPNADAVNRAKGILRPGAKRTEERPRDEQRWIWDVVTDGSDSQDVKNRDNSRSHY